ncbi:hypothetical protein MYCTH_2053582 [Thermothelomyces thermophilus ATCC 42464]|uniref:Thioesterase domain-containing protein n=1 Tax=Thermothelomyces thermophilus (strain ATCC 42464 / BCRC 31852 / DSM 1799) TaxID=573729 RepID=G2Q3W6_THET4|nr:uncharacterized protein MYCTH_2053582 [Thermothelomyces thermophilus ATCC 42464]AEO55269.1 hypothetical protein MYCTH_2053582 [Thermothelomyces thermophilus ATCC 42464]
MGTVGNNGRNKLEGRAGAEEGQHLHQEQKRSKQRQSAPIAQRCQKKKKQPAHSGLEDHNQHVADPLAHFLAIPWAARLLTGPATFGIVVPDRRPLASGDKRLVRSVLNGAGTVRACVTFFMKLPAHGEEKGNDESLLPLSRSTALLRSGGPRDGEDPERPFLLFNALLDLGEDLCGYKGMMHGGALAVILDETMCAAADNQTGCAFTATMSISFLRPVKLPGPVIVRSRVVKKQGRKIHVRGAIEDGEGQL